MAYLPMRTNSQANIRRASAEEAAFLPDIECSAARAFQQLPNLGWTPGNFVESVEEHLASIARGTLWVAESSGRIVGFLTAETFGAELHINEFDVHLDHQRRGIGRLLIAAAVDYARMNGSEAVTLTTFRDVPWNGPFYANLGFEFVKEAELGLRLKSILEREAAHGLPPEKRCAMRIKFRVDP
jgi:GNAT superfamily N-acetyltransferase